MQILILLFNKKSFWMQNVEIMGLVTTWLDCGTDQKTSVKSISPGFDRKLEFGYAQNDDSN